MEKHTCRTASVFFNIRIWSFVRFLAFILISGFYSFLVEPSQASSHDFPPVSQAIPFLTGELFSTTSPESTTSTPWLSVVAEPSPPTVIGSGVGSTFGNGTISYSALIIYSDAVAVDVSTIGTGDILINGPNGYSALATFVGVDNPTNGSPRTATYAVSPPGGSWDFTDNGPYDKVVQPGQVANTSGLFVAPGVVGTFFVDLPTSGCFANFNSILDGGFEANTDAGTNPNWTSTSTAFGSALCNLSRCGPDTQPRNGNGWVRFDGAVAGINGEAANVRQTVTIPFGSSAATLATLDPGTMAMLRTALEKAGQPILLVVNKTLNFAGLMAPYGMNGDVRTWATEQYVTLSTRDGIVVATRGFGPDLMSAAAPSLAQIAAGQGNVARRYYYLDGADQTRSFAYGCSLTRAGGETITILAKPYATSRITESCSGPAGSFKNEYWFDNRHILRQSHQFFRPEADDLLLQSVID